jgi:hypothetical protein
MFLYTFKKRRESMHLKKNYNISTFLNLKK